MVAIPQMNVQVDGPKLPIEIIDQVIDHLHDDRMGLLSCALVSRSCLLPSRIHLFRKIRVIVRMWDGFDTAQRFCHLLEHTPSISRHIRHLTLDGVLWWGEDEEDRPYTSEICSHMLSNMLLQLPRLAVLKYCNSGFRCDCKEDLPVAVRTNLDILVLRGVDTSTPGALIAIVRVPTEVQTLDIASMELDSDQMSSGEALSSLSSSQSLALNQSYHRHPRSTRALSLTLRSRLVPGALNCLLIDHRHPTPNIVPFESPFKGAGDYDYNCFPLRRRPWGFGSMDIPSRSPYVWPDSLLADFSNLHTLRFRVDLVKSYLDHYSLAWPVLEDAITDIFSFRSHSIRMMAFDLSFSSSDLPDRHSDLGPYAFPFEPIRAAMHRFKDLHTVVFSVTSHLDCPLKELKTLAEQITHEPSDFNHEGRLLLL